MNRSEAAVALSIIAGYVLAFLMIIKCSIMLTNSLTQKPTSPNHRLLLTASEAHNGRSTFATGTGPPAPYETTAIGDAE